MLMSNTLSELARPPQGESAGPASGGSPNEVLRQFVEASGLSQPVAMTIFNRQLGAAACSETEWRGFLSEIDSPRYRELSASQLAHAIDQFSRIGVHREQN